MSPLVTQASGGLLVAATLGGVAWVAILLRQSPAPASRAAQAQPEMQAEPAQVAVVDAGTLRLGEHVIRLSGVRPPARGLRCAAGTDCAAAGANALEAIVRETPVFCRIAGEDGSGNPYGVCEAGGTDLGCAVVAAGWARAGEGPAALVQAEAQARAARRGIWAAQDDADW